MKDYSKLTDVKVSPDHIAAISSLPVITAILLFITIALIIFYLLNRGQMATMVDNNKLTIEREKVLIGVITDSTTAIVCSKEKIINLSDDIAEIKDLIKNIMDIAENLEKEKDSGNNQVG